MREGNTINADTILGFQFPGHSNWTMCKPLSTFCTNFNSLFNLNTGSSHPYKLIIEQSPSFHVKRGAEWAEGPGRGQRVGWAEGGVEWAEAEDGQKRWVGRVGGLGRGGFMEGSEGPGGWQQRSTEGAADTIEVCRT